MAEIELPIERYRRLQKEIGLLARRYKRNPEEIKILIVTKGIPISSFKDFIDQGITEFAESRIQEVVEKKAHLPKNTSFHLIGTLQTKKVPKVVGLFQLIHSVNSFDLAKKISECCIRENLKQDVLLQVNTSDEAQKHGFTKEQLLHDIEKIIELEGIRVRGLMTMAAFMDTKSEIERERTRTSFKLLSDLKKKLCEKYPKELSQFLELSMGMSQDYDIAIEQGATILRIGSHIFRESRG